MRFTGHCREWHKGLVSHTKHTGTDRFMAFSLSNLRHGAGLAAVILAAGLGLPAASRWATSWGRARRAMLMSAYCYYKANHYTDAISTADSYIQLHPGSKEVAYAFYLKAVSLYEQIVDVGRDQSNTEDALTALQDVVQRFPDTEYARDATLKIDLTLDHLAGKEMAVGRYYLRNQDYIGAINRFRTVVEQYQKTSQIAEALERLTEAYYALGIYNEAKNAAAVLGANYPGSPWYQDAYKLLTKHGMKPEVDDRSWLSKTFGKI